MRLWSLHPSVLDRQGLVACWREALLAQAVLLGRTRGYTTHPQLDRFKVHARPEAAIGSYLAAIQQEATARGYRFDATRIVHAPDPASATGELDTIPVTFGQLGFELSHLRAKLFQRSPEFLAEHAAVLDATDEFIPVHPLFRPVPGTIEPWERT